MNTTKYPAKAATFYVPIPLKEAHINLCKRLGYKSQSARIRELIEKDLTEHEGKEVRLEFELEPHRALRDRYKKDEQRYELLLREELLPNRKSAYEAMIDFAKGFGTDDSLVENIDEVLKQLTVYDCSGSEPFNDSTLMTFIFYLQAVLKRREVEEKIKQHIKCSLNGS